MQTTRSSIIYTRSANWLLDVPIRAWDAGDMTHAGVRIENMVVDATFRHGVQKWDLEEWLAGRVVVSDLPVYPTTQGAGEQAERELFVRIGQKYDILEILGYPLLRDLGHPDRPVCSRLGIEFLNANLMTSLVPGRQGRIGPRILNAAHHSYNVGFIAGTKQPC